MNSAALLFALPVCTALGACSHVAGNAPQNDEPSAREPAKSPPLVIGALKTHDAKVSIVGGRAGKELRVIVRKDDGTLVADDATLDELRGKDPATWQVVVSALAQREGTYVDATLDHAPEPTSLPPVR